MQRRWSRIWWGGKEHVETKTWRGGRRERESGSVTVWTLVLGRCHWSPLFPLIKTAELPLISSLSLYLLPSLSPPPPLLAPNLLLHSFLFFCSPTLLFFLSQGSPAGGKSRPSQRSWSFYFTIFFFLLLLSHACGSFLPLSPFSPPPLPPRASSVRWSSSNDRSRGRF